jgi:DNA-binding GntR family transcriptional regulator
MRELGPLSRPQSLTDAVVIHIRDAIISGELAPGQQLAEVSLAKMFGTSRGTVREAVRVLANLGLVSLAAHRSLSITLLTPQRAREIYTLRALLESFAARMAAEDGRIDAAAIAMLEDRQATLAEAARIGDVGALVDADMEFHRSLSALAGHELLLEHLAGIHLHSRRLLIYSDLYEYSDVNGPEFGAVAIRHDRLVDTIRGGDPDAIERAVIDHITPVGRTIVARIAAMETPHLTEAPPVAAEPEAAVPTA